MEYENLSSYIAALYGAHSSTSKVLDARDAQNIVNDILVALILNELPAGKRAKVTAACGDIIRLATGRGMMLSSYHDDMLNRLTKISQIAVAVEDNN